MAIVIAILSALAWSVYDVKRKQLVEQWPATVLAASLAFAVTPFYLMLWIAENHPIAPPAYWLPALASLGVSTLAAVGFIQALKIGQMALLIPVLAITPIVSSLASFLFFEETLHALQWLAMIAIVVSIFLLNGGLALYSRSDQAAPAFWLILMVAICWGLGTVFDKKALVYSTPFYHGLIQSFGMALILLIVHISQPKPDSIPIRLFQFGGFWLAVLAFLIAVSTQLYALELLHAGLIETLKRAVGIVGALLWGLWLFKERILIWQYYIIGLILLMTVLFLQPNIL